MQATLCIHFLGQIQAVRNGELLPPPRTQKARGLLAYLVVEGNRMHQRQALAGMFWPEYSERRARASLSQALYLLRQALEERPPAAAHFLADRDTIGFDPDSDHWVDVIAFSDCLRAATGSASNDEVIGCLEDAVAFYRGAFLSGFSLPDSPAFECWSLLERERLHACYLQALERLADGRERRCELESALHVCQQLVAVDPWRDTAQEKLIRLLALTGRRSAALAQYDSYRRALDLELGLAPMDTTTLLVEQIRAGLLQRPIETVSPEPADGDRHLPPGSVL